MTTTAAPLRSDNLLERYFGFAARGTTFARDTMAGATTFVVMSYIIFLNPIILTGATPKFGPTLAFSAVLTSTCLVAGVMSMLMVSMGLVFPPVGMIAFVVSSSANVSLVKVYTGTSILMIALVLTTILIMIFPGIVLWLPNTMK